MGRREESIATLRAGLAIAQGDGDLAHMLCHVYKEAEGWKEVHELLTAQHGSKPIAEWMPDLAATLACSALRLGPPRALARNRLTRDSTGILPILVRKSVGREFGESSEYRATCRLAWVLRRLVRVTCPCPRGVRFSELCRTSTSVGLPADESLAFVRSLPPERYSDLCSEPPKPESVYGKCEVAFDVTGGV